MTGTAADPFQVICFSWFKGPAEGSVEALVVVQRGDLRGGALLHHAIAPVEPGELGEGKGKKRGKEI